MKSFFQNAQVDTTKNIKMVEGASYLPWVVALDLAGRPEQTIAVCPGSGQIIREVLGGGVVAIDMKVGDAMQRTWLPILDRRNAPVAFGKITSRDANDAIQRCRAKAVAMVSGIGMSLYAGHNGNASEFIDKLGVRMDSDLGRVKAIVSEKKDSRTGRVISTYLDWATALSAARITDPDFHWEVEMHVDPETGAADTPYLKVNETFMVSIAVTHKGIKHTEYLPIMGVMPVQTKNGVKKMDHQPLTAPSVFDWNRSVMRCLAKGISVLTGYGLALYGADEVSDLGNEQDQPEPQPPKVVDLKNIRQLLKDTGKDEGAMCAWLGIPTLEEASFEDVTKAEEVLRKSIRKVA